MKKICLFTALVLAAVLTLCACSKQTKKDSSVQYNNPVNGVSQSSGQAGKKSIDLTPETQAAFFTLSDCIGVAREERFNSTDSVGNSYDFTYRIPKFLLSSADAESTNTAIADTYAQYFEEAENNMRDGYSQYCYYLDFEAYLFGDIVSAAVCQKFEGGSSFYRVYVLDTSGAKLDNKAIVSKLGLDYDATMDTLLSLTEADFNDSFGSYATDANREKTLSRANIEVSPLYINDMGNLCAVVMEYIDIAGGEFPHIIEIETAKG